MQKHNLHISGVVLACALFLASGAARALDPVRIAIAAPGSSLYINVEAARDLELFEKHGIDAEITAYRGGGPMQEAIAGGAGDMLGHTPPSVALAVAKGVREKIVGADVNSPVGYHIAVRRDSDFTSPADLDGGTIAVSSKASLTDFYALWFLDKHGIDADIVPVGAGRAAALITQRVDAGVLSPSEWAAAEAAAGVRSLADLGVELENSLPIVWVATNDFIEQHPDRIRRTLLATYEAAKYLKENEEYALALLRRYTRQEDPDLLRLDYETAIAAMSTSGAIKREWLDLSLRLTRLADLGEIPEVDELYTDKFADVSAE